MPVLPKDMVWAAIRTGASSRAQVTDAPRFRIGDAVLARNTNPIGHTRLPRYIRGKRGIIQCNHGGFVFADTRAHGLGDHPQYVYSVRFEARELWGSEASPHDGVYIDLWESYIEPVPSR
jgi:nitrile hydratase subunit beta